MVSQDNILFSESIINNITYGMGQVSFQWKNLHFPLKNPDLLLKNPDFLLKNVDFIIKQGHLPEATLEMVKAACDAANVTM